MHGYFKKSPKEGKPTVPFLGWNSFTVVNLKSFTLISLLNISVSIPRNGYSC